MRYEIKRSQNGKVTVHQKKIFIGNVLTGIQQKIIAQ